MSIYQYVCHDCKLIWDREYRLAKNPTRTRCPECKTLCEKNWGSSRNQPPVHFIGGVGAGWTTKGGGELMGSSDDMIRAMQEGCKKRMDKGYEAYKIYSPSKGYIDSVGARRRSDEEVRKVLQDSKKASAENYDKIGIDPYKQNYKPQ